MDGSSWAISQVAGLGRQCRDEAVDGCGVLHVAQQLAAAPAGDVAPLEGGVRVLQGDAPPPLRHADGRAVPAGQERQPPPGGAGSRGGSPPAG